MNRTSYLVQTPFSWKWIGYFLGAVVLVFGLSCAHEAIQPDYLLRFDRQVVSSENPLRLSDDLFHVENWPKWFSNVVAAQILGSDGHPLPSSRQVAVPGAVIRLTIESKRGMSSRSEMVVRVKKAEQSAGAERKLELKVLGESTGKLFRSFEDIRWQITMSQLPSADGPRVTAIHGEETMLTADWRARVFGLFARRIMMNQIFYPDLIRLANPGIAKMNELEKGQPM